MGEGSNIAVSVRLRPLQRGESDGRAWTVQSAQAVADESGSKAYSVDSVFSEDSSQHELFMEVAQPLVRELISGYNCCILAYGQTASGKTHTMRGSPDDPGITPRTVHALFDLIEQQQKREFLVRVSFIELVNEQLHDLLDPARSGSLRPKEDPSSGDIFVDGVCEHVVTSAHHALELMDFGEQRRATAKTGMNAASSRSHALFRMVCESRARSDGDDKASPECAVRVSHCTLVDLAGSERAAKAGSEGVRLREGAYINKSLMCLGTVINRLTERCSENSSANHSHQQQHVPYRDSKLTRILQPSLGGNARCAMICTITPSRSHADETHNTLRFATRAKAVRNNARVNEIVSDAAMLQRQKREIEELREEKAEAERKVERLTSVVLNVGETNDFRKGLQRNGQRSHRRRASIGATELSMAHNTMVTHIRDESGDIESNEKDNEESWDSEDLLSTRKRLEQLTTSSRRSFSGSRGDVVSRKASASLSPIGEVEKNDSASAQLTESIGDAVCSSRDDVDRELALEKAAGPLACRMLIDALSELNEEAAEEEATTAGTWKGTQNEYESEMEREETHVRSEGVKCDDCSTDREADGIDREMQAELSCCDTSDVSTQCEKADECDVAVQCVKSKTHEEEAQAMREQKENAERTKQLEEKLKEREKNLTKLMHRHKQQKTELERVQAELEMEKQKRLEMEKRSGRKRAKAPLQPIVDTPNSDSMYACEKNKEN